MELFSNDHFHVLVHPDKQHTLVINRIDGTIGVISYEDAVELENLKKVASLCGPLIGIYLNSHLVLVKQRSFIGNLYEPITKTEHEVYAIKDVLIVPILNDGLECIPNDDIQYSSPYSANLNTAKYDSVADEDSVKREDDEDESQRNFSLPTSISSNSVSYQRRTKPWNAFRVPNYLKLKFTNASKVNISATKYSNDLKKRLNEEMSKLFIDANSFYFSHTIDLTTSISRKPMIKKSNEATWKFADERFFWNRHMLKNFIELDRGNFPGVNYFIVPILHGFIQLEDFDVNLFESAFNDTNDDDLSSITGQFNSIVGYIDKITSKAGNINSSDFKLTQSKSFGSTDKKTCQLGLISRRSVFQAGTRYRKRGCDENGNCANFVETEQLFRYGHHQVSYIIIRGSIPLFWSQPGFKYRPAPVLSRTDDENQLAFSKHFQDLLFHYGTDLTLVDCTEHTGREKIVHEAYKQHYDIFRTSQPNIRYIEFDFHRYCGGKLLLKVEEHLKNFEVNEKMIKDMRYYWHDAHGLICEQTGIFRVNCIDCLDRTNIVQRAIALQVLDVQLTRLGLMTPDIDPESNKCRKLMQLIWANNGDVLSRQYAGSNALKGDFTRTGERKLYGYLKDTYSSASRYYISKFRDAYRQAAMDAMLGIESINLENDILETKQTNCDTTTERDNSKVDIERFEEIDDQERMKNMLDDCKMIIFDESQQIVNSWLLISCDPYQVSDLEVLFIMTTDSYYIIDYDELAERINNFQQVKFEDIELVELGDFNSKSIFSKSNLSQISNPEDLIVRINYKIDIQSGYFHMLRAFNPTSSSSQNVLNSFVSTLRKSIEGRNVLLITGQQLAKNRSIIPGIVNENTCLMISSFHRYDLDKVDNESGPSRPWLSAYNLEPLLSHGSRRGTDVLRNVGSRVSSKLARLKGKFYNQANQVFTTKSNFEVRKSDLEKNARELHMSSLQRSSSDTSLKHFVESRNSQLRKTDIDWPSSESVDNIEAKPARVNLSQVNEDDDFYDDDDYNGEQAMFSIDVTQLQNADGAINTKPEDENIIKEEIDMTALTGIDMQNKKKSDNSSVKSSKS